MASEIKRLNNGVLPLESGYGIPIHISTGGSLYVDLSTYIYYINKGISQWSEIPDQPNTGFSGNTFINSFSYNNQNRFTITRNDGITFQTTINTMTGLTVTGNLIVSAITFTNSATTVTITGLTDTFITGGTFTKSASTLSLVNNSGSTVTITGFTDNDRFITGGTFNSNTLSLVNNSGSTVTVTGFTSSSNIEYTGSFETTGITWVGTTAPTTLISSSFRALKSDNVVHLHVALDYTTAGLSLTGVVIKLSGTSIPTPANFSSFTGTTDNIYTGNGRLIVNRNTSIAATNIGFSVIRNSATGMELFIGGTSGSQRVAIADITYFIE